MMRLLAVNSTRIWGGAEAWFETFCTRMAERSHEITLVCHPDSELRRRLSGDSRLRIAPIAIRAEINYFRSLQLARVLRDARPDVLIGSRPKDVKLSAVASWFAGPVPILHIKHYGEPLKNRLDFRFFWTREVTAMVVLSAQALNRLRHDAPWLGDTPIEVIHNGVDTEEFSPKPEARERARAELGIPHDVFVVSFHGRLAPPKRVDLVVRAIATAAERTPIYGLIIGDGPEGPSLRKLADVLDAQVIFAGFRDDASMLLPAADVEITMSEIEGAVPLAVLEAMACGLPVIASHTTSHPEVLEGGVNGLLVEPGVPEGAAAAMLQLARDPQARAAMGAAARSHAVQHFEVAMMIDRYESLLERLVQARADRAR
ncbi:MAG: glycosyltransferase family 4 protein [Gemmatimonadetes bacterium]|uniref:Glycosyltransferase family 4 protein n=1 Tax=Candidatus Kutchimonas denitrificans TaxID=3056748 RepID=A0AAE5CAR2_9BACT|nr:glycosyltransferase family 4 protein [Gemmatimonadota bacterium]NIR74837.1 glycosyltransferase family 4 protein [Candidatus Kutchimonas denitrificans]NIR99948.1 glycosyltransferase family 4 protein [Gemmatimonadota bacterium]NIT65532.1 glycosyltransferase family 4 protein [Gemmatimonadota bacterium]NIU52502.1 glycosyltransferase [Gemmatimonadota bacterium]